MHTLFLFDDLLSRRSKKRAWRPVDQIPQFWMAQNLHAFVRGYSSLGEVSEVQIRLSRPERARGLNRRQLIADAGTWGLLAGAATIVPRYALGSEALSSRRPLPQGGSAVTLRIRDIPFAVDGRHGRAVSINGTVPGPLIRLREGTPATIRVTNELAESSSIHWHGLLVPPSMDGVPGVSFRGIQPGETFTYSFPVTQAGTYWYHSHSGGQELTGMYGPIIIDPARPDPFAYDRDFIVMLSDWSPLAPMSIIDRLKSDAGYFNYQRQTAEDFYKEAKQRGVAATLQDCLAWAKMRMDPTDLADVTGATFSYLMNGLPPSALWTGLFRKGERVRLRFIGAASMTMFDVRIPGAHLTLVQADGQNVEPVEVDEFRIAPGETYDVIVHLPSDQPYTVFAESSDRSGYAAGVLTPKGGLAAKIPVRRKPALLSMADMGMAMSAMNMDPNASDMNKMPGMKAPPPPPTTGDKMPQMRPDSGMQAMDMANMPGMNGVAKSAGGGASKETASSPIPGSTAVTHGPDHHGPGNSSVPMETKSRLGEPGTGLGDDGWRVLVYTDLRRLLPAEDHRPPGREIELHLTGNMDRYMWSFDGKKYSESPDPVPFKFGERLRLTLVNDTMMSHPMHLHGMWMYLENGHGLYLPRKHTIVVKPAERLSVAITAETPGRWAFHCHLLLHMEMGMFCVVEISPATAGASL